MTTAISSSVQTEMNAKAVTLSETMKQLTVTDEESYRYAGEVQRGGKALKQQVVEFFEPHKKRAHEAWKALCADCNALTEPLDAGISHAQRIMGAWKAELEKQRAVELAAAKAKAEAEARAANQAVAEVENDLFISEAETEEKIAAIQESAAAKVAAAVAEVNAIVPKVEGQVSRANWKFEIVDVKLLPREYLVADEKAIGAMVRARKGETNIPGVRVYPDYKVSV